MSIDFKAQFVVKLKAKRDTSKPIRDHHATFPRVYQASKLSSVLLLVHFIDALTLTSQSNDFGLGLRASIEGSMKHLGAQCSGKVPMECFHSRDQ